MGRRSGVITVACLTTLGGGAAVAQDAAPRTPWGAPDLQAVWDFRTITPLQRPDGLGDQEFLSQRQDPIMDSFVDFDPNDRSILGFNAGPPLTPGAYNNNNMQLFQTPDHVVIRSEMVQMYEFACHEGSYSMPVMLGGRRAEELAAGR